MAFHPSYAAHTTICLDLGMPGAPVTTLGVKPADAHVDAHGQSFVLFYRPATTVSITVPEEGADYAHNFEITYTALAQCEDPYDGPYEYMWAFDDATTDTGATVLKTWGTSGNHTATVTALNTSTGDSPTDSVTVSTAVATTVVITAPTLDLFGVGESITYTAVASCSAPFDGPYTYAWAFDDATTDTGATVSKSWATAGNHTATVTATNTSTGETPTDNVTIRAADAIGAMTYPKFRTKAIYVPAKDKAYILGGEGPGTTSALSVLTVADGASTVTLLQLLTVAGGHDTRSCANGLPNKMARLIGNYIVAMGSDSGAASSKKVTQLDTTTDTFTSHTQYADNFAGYSTTILLAGGTAYAGPGVSAGASYFVGFTPGASPSTTAGNRINSGIALDANYRYLALDDGIAIDATTFEDGDPVRVLPQPPALETDPWVIQTPHTSYVGVGDLTYAAYDAGILAYSAVVFQNGVDISTTLSALGSWTHRLEHAVVYLGSNKWLFVGGRTGGDYTTALNTGEVLDMATGLFTAVSNTMSAKRMGIGGGCVLVGNGNVMIVGGQDETGTVLSSIEFYNVAQNKFVAYN